MKRTLFFLLLFFTAIPAYCHESGKINCFVSIIPQSYFVERIGGGVVKTDVVVPPGQSPHSFEPTPKQLAAIVNSDIYFTTGMPFEERLLIKIRGIAPDIKVVDTTQAVELMRLETEHSHGSGHLENERHSHHHGDSDPHVWLDPKLAIQQAETIADALINLSPEYSQLFKRNMSLLKSDLEKLDRDIAEMLMPYKGRSIFVFHPAYGYFARAYALLQVSVEAEGKEPGARHLANVIEKARRAETKAVFAEIQYSPKSAETIAAHIGAEVVMLDPLAKDYISNMMHIAAQIRKSFSDDR